MQVMGRGRESSAPIATPCFAAGGGDPSIVTVNFGERRMMETDDEFGHKRLLRNRSIPLDACKFIDEVDGDFSQNFVASASRRYKHSE
jgi:hypothetical protein